MKPGWQTTEFWVTAATVIGTLLVAVLSPEKATVVGEHTEKAGQWLAVASLVIGGMSGGAYTLSRLLLKRGEQRQNSAG